MLDFGLITLIQSLEKLFTFNMSTPNLQAKNYLNCKRITKYNYYKIKSKKVFFKCFIDILN